MNAPPLTGTNPSTSFLEKIKGFIGTGNRGYWVTLLLVLTITIAVFTGIFYIYTPSEVMPFAAGSTIAVVVLLLLGVLYQFSAKNQIANTITRFAFSLYFFMPYALFTFGIISDSISRKLQYFPAGLAGFTGILFNYALSLISTGGKINTVENALCEIPGLSSLSSTLAPQSMMFTLSALAYIATYVNRSNIGGSKGFVLDFDYRWPSWVLFFSVAVLHLIVLKRTGCLANNMQIVYGVALPLLWGGLLGFIGFAILERTPSGSPPPDSSTVPPEKEKTTATCSADGQSGEFTCE
jgi:hypothetical protein